MTALPTYFPDLIMDHLLQWVQEDHQHMKIKVIKHSENLTLIWAQDKFFSNASNSPALTRGRQQNDPLQLCTPSHILTQTNNHKEFPSLFWKPEWK